MKTVKEKAKDFRRKFERDFVPEISERDKIEVAFIAGYNEAQIWISVEEALPDTGHDGISENVLLRLQIKGKLSNTHTAIIEAFYDSDIEEWCPMLPIKDKNLKIYATHWRIIN